MTGQAKDHDGEDRGPPPAGSPLIGSSGDSVAQILALGLEDEHIVAVPRPRPKLPREDTHQGFTAIELLPVMDQCLTWVMGRDVHCVDMLSDEKTKLRDVRLIKSVAKRLCAGACSRPWRGLTRAIYFSSIAAGLVHHEQLISAKPVPQLTKVLGLLHASPCLPRELRPIVLDAHDALRLDAESSGCP
ncbi:MAG: hypothetical protein KAS72_01435 [Phycisphaerales bacterium]|nr:hypothetical protein [Phycisphaerales bacterium]